MDESTKTMRVAKEATKGSVFLFIGNASSMAVLAITSIIIARLLGPSDYGLYSLAITVPSLLLLLTDFGINPALTRFISRYKSKDRNSSIGGLIRAGIWFKLVINTSMFLLSFSIAGLLAEFLKRPDIGPLIQIASLDIIGLTLYNAAINIFAGLDSMDRSAMISILYATIKMIMVTVLMASGLGVTGALMGHVLGSLVVGILGVVLVLRISVLPKYRTVDGARFMPTLDLMIRYGLPVYASTLLAGLLTQYQSLVLAWYATNAEIGNYSVVKAFAALMDSIITIPISIALLPAFTKFDGIRDANEVKSFFLIALRYTLILVTPASFFIATASNDLVAFLFGSDYTNAPLYLTLHAVVPLLAALNLVITNFFNGIGKTDLSFKSSLMQLPVAIPLLPLFTSLYGVPGIIYTVIIWTACQSSYLILMGLRRYKLTFDVRRIILIMSANAFSSILTAFLISYSPQTYLVRLIMSFIIFTFLSSIIGQIMGVLRPEDLEALRAMSKDIMALSKVFDLLLRFEEKIYRLSHIDGAKQ